MVHNIYCNTRVLNNNLTGVQRYILELTSRFGDKISIVKPKNNVNGVNGHLWEQAILPMKVRDNLLWSPSNTGPIFVKNQVLTLHDVNAFDNPEWVSPNFARLYRLIIPRLVKNVRRIITDSNFSKERISYHFPSVSEKIVVIPLAADSRFQNIPHELLSHELSAFKLPYRRYFIALGSIEPRKNLPRLLTAWRNALPYLPPDVGLILVGSQGKKIVFGDYSLGELPPRIHFTGHVDDKSLPSLYSGAIASVYVSLYEGFGLPPLESMSCGTPVIFSNVASLPEVMGSTGLAINPFNIDEIADALIQVSNNDTLRHRLSKEGLDRSKIFSWDRTANETWKVLSEML